MSSAIDATKPITGQTVVKSQLRANFAAAKSEIENLQTGKQVILPTYADNAAAVTGGLLVNDLYKTGTGEVRVVI